MIVKNFHVLITLPPQSLHRDYSIDFPFFTCTEKLIFGECSAMMSCFGSEGASFGIIPTRYGILELHDGIIWLTYRDTIHRRYDKIEVWVWLHNYQSYN